MTKNGFSCLSIHGDRHEQLPSIITPLLEAMSTRGSSRLRKGAGRRGRRPLAGESVVMRERMIDHGGSPDVLSLTLSNACLETFSS
jgi:hypothetical protein